MDKEKINSYLVKVTIGISVSIVLMLIRGFSTIVFADGLFLAGAFMMGIAGLNFVSREGGYDMFGYSFYYVFKNKSGQYKDYKDYQEKNLLKKKKNKFDFSLLITGVIFVLISLIIYFII
jgi:uncharacterized membrane protein